MTEEYPVIKMAIPCERCGGLSTATELWFIPKGCICSQSQVQALCPQHGIKAESSGPMYVIAKLDPDLPALGRAARQGE